MNTIIKTAEFDKWMANLKDMKAKARIVSRLLSAERGNFGDCKFVGDGVSEMRIDVGAGYRIYYVQRGKVVYVVLCGGDKSTQTKDIKTATTMAAELED